MPMIKIAQNQIQDLVSDLLAINQKITNDIATQHVADEAEFEPIGEAQRLIDLLPDYLPGTGISIEDDENGDKVISISDIDLFKIVSELPEVGTSNKIYMVTPSDRSDDFNNLFIEHVWIENEDYNEEDPTVDNPDFDIRPNIPNPSYDPEGPEDPENNPETILNPDYNPNKYLNAPGRWEVAGQLSIKLDAYAKTTDVVSKIAIAVADALQEAAAAAAIEIAKKTVTASEGADIVPYDGEGEGEPTLVPNGIITLAQNEVTIEGADKLISVDYVDKLEERAAADATAKADSARNAAIITAASDATAKVNAKDVTAAIDSDGIVTLKKNGEEIAGADSLASTDYVDNAIEDAVSTVADAKDVTAVISNDIVTLQKGTGDEKADITNATSLATKKYVDDIITAVDTDDIITIKKNNVVVENAGSLATKKYVDDHDAAILDTAEEYTDDMGEAKDVTATIDGGIVTLHKGTGDSKANIPNATSLVAKTYADELIIAVIDGNGIVTLKKEIGEEEPISISNATSLASTDYADKVADDAKEAAIEAIPTHLPNPFKLIFGDIEYDGSEEIELPSFTPHLIDVTSQADGITDTFSLPVSDIAGADVWLNGVNLLVNVDYNITNDILTILRADKVKSTDRLWITYHTSQLSDSYASTEQGYRADSALQPTDLDNFMDGGFIE
jgi:hypothetical protein